MENKFLVNSSKYNKKYNFYVRLASSLVNPKSNSVMFITKSYENKLEIFTKIKECIVFYDEKILVNEELKKNNLFIKSKNPRLEFAKFFKENKISDFDCQDEGEYINGAYISKNSTIGKNVIIFPFAYIGKGCIIEDNSIICSGAKLIKNVEIGKNCYIGENTVIGCSGLTTMKDKNNEVIDIPQFGNVIIEENVRIGSNTSIARGAIDKTIIQKGSRIDNSCFISHNVNIGKNNLIVGETIMFGSSKTGDNVYISGNSTVREGVEIGEDSLIGMGSVVVKNIGAYKIVKGNPAK